MEMWNYVNIDLEGSLVYFKKFDKVALWLGVIVLALTGYILWSRKRSKLPPGPVGLPVFGYYFFLKKNPLATIEELGKKYGNIFGLYLGPKYVVFLNDWEAVKDGLGQSLTLDRPIDLFKKFQYRFGFSGANGAEWLETRRLGSKVMKDGLEKNHWEDLIEKELSDVVARITEMNGKPIELRSFLRDSFSSIVMSLLLGYRIDVSNPFTKTISTAVDSIVENVKPFLMFNFSEILSVFLNTIGLEKAPPFASEINEMLKFVSNAVDSNIGDTKSEKNDSFISRYQNEVDIRKKSNQKTYASEDHLKGSLAVLMVGGNETTRTTMIWALIAMADHPDKQRKVHEELDRVYGKDVSVRWSDRGKIPYTLAALLESMRWKTTVPVPAMREVIADTHIQGYQIPKGAFVATNIFSLHTDSRYWEHPDQYIPERFLLEDGRKVNMAPESFLPFSYGKRNCPGKLLALMDTLQYFSTLMGKFEVLPKEGDKVKYDAVLGLSYQARNAEMRFIPR